MISMKVNLHLVKQIPKSDDEKNENRNIKKNQ